MVGGEPEVKALGEGKCFDTLKHKSLHTYIHIAIMLAFSMQLGKASAFIHTYSHINTAC